MPSRKMYIIMITGHIYNMLYFHTHIETYQEAFQNLSKSDAAQLALSFDAVKRCEVYFYADNAVVAIRTEPIFLRSENEKLIRAIEKELEKHPNIRKAYVTQDVNVYCELKKLNEKNIRDADASRMIEKIIALIS